MAKRALRLLKDPDGNISTDWPVVGVVGGGDGGKGKCQIV